ncbi:MAG: ImmA/IrrE family metallo-endopeptidase [Eubacterium sp.]|nr:ImmA/IrrE family metallo-endopeptidase [Eubacterium sp.]
MDERIFRIPERLIRRHDTRDPFQLAKRLGYCVKFINTKKQKGFCKIYLNNYFIFINENMSPQMQRMTCAHELGHLLLHKDALTKQGCLVEMELFDITDQRELEANQFAANILIDDEELLELLKDGNDVVRIASMLHVNVNMLMVKLLTMNKSGYDFNVPFEPKSAFMGTIEDRADSI